MTKMRTRAMVAAMVTMSVMAAGCGSKTAKAPGDDVVMESVMETVEETTEASTEETVEETKGIVKETTKAVESVVGKTETTKAAKKETVKAETKVETKAETKAETKTAKKKTETAKAETKAAAKKETEAPKKAEAPKKETAAPAPKAEAKPAEKPTAAAPTEAPKPAHQHVWKDHVATRQEWVSNIVSVPDYEVQKVRVGSNTICNCGAVNPSIDHKENHILNGEDDGYWYEDVYEEQKVQVGSHDEDQGYYKDVEYVDYQYCDCGATK